MEGLTRTLVISDGGVTSLLACMAACDEALHQAPDAASLAAVRPLVWTGALYGPPSRAIDQAARRQATLLDMEFVESVAAGTTPAWAHGPSPFERARQLLDACTVAARRGAGKVVAPWQHGLATGGIDLNAAGKSVDRAVLMSRLLWLETPEGESSIEIDAPYADLDDHQVADLAVDMDAPIGTCWWWHAELAVPDGSSASGAPFRAEHARWTAALSAAGWRPAGASGASALTSALGHTPPAPADSPGALR